MTDRELVQLHWKRQRGEITLEEQIRIVQENEGLGRYKKALAMDLVRLAV